MKINTYILGLLAVAGLFSFQSCDDESYDVVGNPDNLIYFPPKGQFNNCLLYTSDAADEL